MRRNVTRLYQADDSCLAIEGAIRNAMIFNGCKRI
jgi:hypothetical protein